MVMKQTGKTPEILKFIDDYNALHGYGPTVREICCAVGLRSTSTVARYIARLKKKGLVISEELKPRTLQTVKHMSTVANGYTAFCCTFPSDDGCPDEVIAVKRNEKGDMVSRVKAESFAVM